MQIINDPYLKGGGGVAGKEAGNMLSSAIDQLVQRKMQQVESRYQEREAQKRWAGAGFNNPQDANLLEMFRQAKDPHLYELMRSLEANQGQQGGGGVQDLNNMMAQMGTGQQQPQAQQQMAPQQQMMQAQQAVPQQQVQQPMMQQQRQGRFGGQYLNPQQQIANQRRIDASSKKFRENLDNTFTELGNTVEDAKRALQLIKKGTTRSGITGMLPLGLTMANADTRELQKVYETLALNLSASTRGILSKAKIEAARATKPSLDMPVEAQVRLLNRIIQQAENGGMALGKIKDQLIEENGGLIPEGLETKVHQIYRQLYPQGTNSQRVGTQQDETEQQGAAGPQEENLLANLTRKGISGASRVLAGAAGGLGDIAGAAVGGVNYLSGGRTPNYEELGKKIPLPWTSEQIAQGIDKFTGGYTKPQGGFEELTDDILSTFGSLFMPGKALTHVVGAIGKAGVGANLAQKTGKILLPFSGIQMPATQALKLAAGGELAAKTASAMGAGSGTQTLTRMAFMAAAGTKGGRAALTEEGATLLNGAKQGFAGQKENVSHTIGEITKFENSVKRAAYPDQNYILGLTQELKDGLKKSKGLHPVDSLIEMKQGLNTRFGWSERPVFEGSKEYMPRHLRKPLGRLIDIIEAPILRAGKKNVEAGAKYLQGNDIWKGVHDASNITKWLKGNVEKIKLSQSTSVPKDILKLLSGGAVKSAYELSRMKDMFIRFPQGRKYYLAMMDAALHQNRAAFVQNLARIDQLAKQIEE